MTLAALSARLREIGRPISISALSKIEQAMRRTDADDLVALAEALDVEPEELLGGQRKPPMRVGPYVGVVDQNLGPPRRAQPLRQEIRPTLPELLYQVTTHVGEEQTHDVDAGLRVLKALTEQGSGRRVVADADVSPSRRVTAPTWTPDWPGRTVPGGLDVAWRSALLQRGMDRHYRRGDVLLGQGEVGTCIIVLRSGQARVVASTEDGERVVIGVRVAGEIAGEMSFVDRAPRRAWVIASGPVTGTMIDNHTLNDFIARYPETLIEIAWSLARKLRSAEMRQLVAHDAATRILYALADVVARIGAAEPEDQASRPVDILLSQRELGQLALVGEVSVQRALRRLARRGLVETAYGHVIVRRPDAVLTEAAKGPKSIIHGKALLQPAD